MPLSDEELHFVRTFVRSEAAIVLDDKNYLIESRLTLLAEREGFENASTLVQASKTTPQRDLFRRLMVDALTTNETLFFRDAHPFASLQQAIFPELIANNRSRKRLRIWSAACSTGQEPYSIAMLLRTKFPELDTWKVEILATDLSSAVLDRAQRGCFTQTEINRGLPASFRFRFFTEVNHNWQVEDAIRSMVSFRKLNLIGSWPNEEAFDLICLRNVMIYFDLHTRRNVLQRVSERLLKSGYLLMGTAESTSQLSDAYAPVISGKSTFFRKI